MKYLKQICKGLFISILLITVGVYVYIHFFAKELIQAKISESLGKQVQIESLSYHFPSGLKAKNVSIKDVLEAKRVYAEINVSSLFEDRLDIAVLELVNPIMTIDNSREKKGIAKSNDKENNTNIDESNYHININKITVTNGQVLHALKIGQNSILVKLVNVRGDIAGITLPLKSQKTEFKLESLTSINQSPFDNHNAVTSGWIDLSKKDLEGTFNLIGQTGEDSLRVNLLSSNNEMLVDGKIRLNLLKPKHKSSGGVDKFMVSALRGDVIDAEFSFPAQLDNFRIDELKIPFKGTVSVSSDL